MTTLVLASASPRRRELLAHLGMAFEVRATNVDETSWPGELPDQLVARLALAKAQAGLAAAGGDVVVLAADTVVAVDDEILGKPTNAADARRMLRLLSGRSHRVLTGVAVAGRSAGDHGRGQPAGVKLGPATTISVEVEVTQVHMAPWTADEIDSYVASGDPMDKAGSYAIQEVGDTKVSDYEGSFDNVVGLPLEVTRRMLADVGIIQPPEA